MLESTQREQFIANKYVQLQLLAISMNGKLVATSFTGSIAGRDVNLEALIQINGAVHIKNKMFQHFVTTILTIRNNASTIT